MPSGPVERYDFFLSRRGSVAAIAQEVTDVLTEAKGFNDLFEKTCPQGIRVDCDPGAATKP
jgi:hypothetical protein